jgi:hypothetical protein
MNRRTFNKSLGLGALASLMPDAHGQQRNGPQASEPGEPVITAKPDFTAQIPARTTEWPSRTYRRLLVDTHIPDWDSLFTEFDAKTYVDTVADGGFQSLMQYANSHVGLCLWRTKIGQMHKGMRGRDYFGEVMEQCRRRNLHHNAYYSLIFDDWAYQTHPDWRILPEDGYDAQLFSRTGTVCLNSPYREHALACLTELVSNYDFGGIFLDMMFWPAVCYCPHCTARFWKEEGTEPPRIVDWTNPAWRAFQKARERWLHEFALQVTHTIKQTRQITVIGQCSTFFMPWETGVSFEQADAADFCSGDFYASDVLAGALSYSLYSKVFYSLSRTHPFETMTSGTINLHDFEGVKPFAELLLETSIPITHSSAYRIIDAFKPMGTLNPHTYEFFSQVNAQHDPYERYLGGTLEADVAIYVDRSSFYDPEVTKVPAVTSGLTFAAAGSPDLGLPRSNVGYLAPRLPHMEAVTGAARILKEAHIPYGVVTNATLDQLGQYRAVMVPNVFEMTEEQAGKFREFVRAGGVLYASGASSLDVVDQPAPRFLLEDVLGVRYAGRLGDVISYMSPSNPEMANLIWPQESLGYPGWSVKAQSLPGSEVLATITLPIPGTEKGYVIGRHFAQIWSNPPAPEAGKDPAIVINKFGKGKAIWLAAPIETATVPANQNMVLHLLKNALPGPYKFEADADPAVEVILFHQPENKRMLVGVLNMQEPFPTLPVDATIRVKIPGKAKQVLRLPDEKKAAFTIVGEYVQFHIPSISVFAMALVEYQ